jgi:hypothetical protein
MSKIQLNMQARKYTTTLFRAGRVKTAIACIDALQEWLTLNKDFVQVNICTLLAYKLLEQLTN